MTKPKKKKLLSQNQFCKLIKAGNQKVQAYIRDGMPVEENSLIDPDKAREWIKQAMSSRNQVFDLRAQKLKADVARLQAQGEESELKMRQMRGELHSVKDCTASLGEVLSTVWMEIQALPGRIQQAFPEVPTLLPQATTIVNDSAKRLQDFAESKGVKLNEPKNSKTNS